MSFANSCKNANGGGYDLCQLLHFIGLRNTGFKNAECVAGIHLPNT